MLNSSTDIFASAPISQAGLAARARVKWFNAVKGFGFVSPIGGGADAFLHATVLQDSGYQTLPEGAELTCEILHGPKGDQVLRVVEIDEATMPQPDEDTVPLEGEVKWFAPDKGFGFITPDDGGKDVFIHKSILRRCGMQLLDEGQRVRVAVAQTPKGREATWIAIN